MLRVKIPRKVGGSEIPRKVDGDQNPRKVETVGKKWAKVGIQSRTEREMDVGMMNQTYESCPPFSSQLQLDVPGALQSLSYHCCDFARVLIAVNFARNFGPAHFARDFDPQHCAFAGSAEFPQWRKYESGSRKRATYGREHLEGYFASNQLRVLG
ncbi:hypothetical protein C8R44DRAFT_748949 [Mycena epipterygia]|nr:hypothetical protein C8R44DRAFT_748949 [Mycena epipterygia]